MRVKIYLILSLFCLNACAQAGWSGYYKTYPDTTVDKYIAISATNTTTVTLDKKEVWIELPRDCSGFIIAGFFTPITPPIPFPWFRNWTSAGKNNDGKCHYFVAETRPEANIQLKVGNEIYAPEIKEGLYGYTKYIFPIRAKSIDSGILIIEKNGEEIEVPFEYKYFRFWH
jgi:hypothetical protein